jgi:hypothetical protein
MLLDTFLSPPRLGLAARLASPFVQCIVGKARNCKPPGQLAAPLPAGASRIATGDKLPVL